MKTNFKSICAITRINFFKTTWIAYLVALLSFASSIVQTLIRYLTNTPDEGQVSEGNMLILVIILAAVLIPSVNFGKLMHLNGKKTDFFLASLINYIIFAAVIALINIILYATIDKVLNSVVPLWDITDIFGWQNNGLLAAFFQQFAFYLLLGVVLHTLTAIQTFWWGWVIDLIIAAIISVFIPVPMLRKLLLDFLYIIVFNPNPITHIATCLSLAAGIYALNIPILSRKKI